MTGDIEESLDLEILRIFRESINTYQRGLKEGGATLSFISISDNYKKATAKPRDDTSQKYRQVKPVYELPTPKPKSSAAKPVRPVLGMGKETPSTELIR